MANPSHVVELLGPEDDTERVVMRFSPRSLREFTAMLNMNHLVDAFGNRLTFECRRMSDEDWMFVMTTHRCDENRRGRSSC